MSNRVDHITIVGGGTAGWLAAIMLVTILNRRTDGEAVKVTLIESPNIPTVGVGEATVPGMPILLRSLGIDEAQFMLRCNASFKCGVRFNNWMEDDDGNPLSFIHPFNTPQIIGGFNPALHFHKYAMPEGAHDLGDNLVPNQNFVENKRGPRQVGAGNYDAAFGYAYHLDAGLFAKYLREISVNRGVEHILDDVVEVRLGEDGSVKELELERGGTHPIQFVIDCSGFRGLIISEALKEPFIPWDRHLLCDRALAIQVPHNDIEALDPCTSSSGLGAGWVWNVPLYTRVGTGYVFSSAFRTEEQARDEFLAHLETRNLDVAGEPRCLKMRVGRSRRSWVKNCLAVGLAAGFVEPLESTAIYVIEMAIRTLIHHFPDRGVSPVIADHYNKVMIDLYDEVLDFIVMHYLTSNRRDPFWVAAREEIEVPDTLKERLEFWRYSLPGPGDTPGSRLFDHWNYLYVLYAKGHFKGLEFALEGSVRRGDWERFKQALAETKRLLVKNLPSHYELVTSIRRQAESGKSAPAARAPQGSPLSQPQKATVSVSTTFKPNIKMPTIRLPK